MALSETRCYARKRGLPYKKGELVVISLRGTNKIAEYGISESEIFLRAVSEEMEKVKEEKKKIASNANAFITVLMKIAIFITLFNGCLF